MLLIALCIATSAHSVSAHSDLVGKPAPTFARTAFNGQSVNLEHFHGKVVLLNFWATWCAPCLVEMPTFAAWQRHYGAQGLQVIGISMDDSVTPARRLVEHLKIDYPIAMGNPRLAERYGGVLGLPLTFLIDRHGIVRARFQGETSAATIETKVKSLLASPPPTR
jgi:peroxiredoxin